MKKIIITLSICVVVALTISSCAGNKKCPAYRSQAMPTMGVSR
jgi:hypothetical protein